MIDIGQISVPTITNKILSLLYYFYCTVSAILTGMLTFFNFSETIDQLNGRATLFTLMTTMTHKQRLIYLILLTTALAIVTVLLIRWMRKGKRWHAVITATLGWIIIVAMLAIESKMQFQG